MHKIRYKSDVGRARIGEIGMFFSNSDGVLVCLIYPKNPGRRIFTHLEIDEAKASQMEHCFKSAYGDEIGLRLSKKGDTPSFFTAAFCEHYWKSIGQFEGNCMLWRKNWMSLRPCFLGWRMIDRYQKYPCEHGEMSERKSQSSDLPERLKRKLIKQLVPN